MRERVNRVDTVDEKAKANVYDTPTCPRPRELKLLKALVTGEAKTVTAALRQAGFHESSGTLRDRLAPGGDLRNQLTLMLEEADLSLPVALKKLRVKIDAKKTVFNGKVATQVDDNDAQLRATEQVIKLHERAGSVPTASDGPVAGSITVNVLMMNTEQAEPQTKDLTVENES